MEQHVPTRFEQIDSVFTESRRALQGLAVKDGLDLQEVVAYEHQLRCWFHGFARRPGNETKKADALQKELLSAAHEYAAEFKRFFRELKLPQAQPSNREVSSESQG